MKDGYAVKEGKAIKVDLAKMGVDKLLGSGKITTAVEVLVQIAPRPRSRRLKKPADISSSHSNSELLGDGDGGREKSRLYKLETVNRQATGRKKAGRPRPLQDQDAMGHRDTGPLFRDDQRVSVRSGPRARPSTSSPSTVPSWPVRQAR